MSVMTRSISPPLKYSNASSADGAVNTLKPSCIYNCSNCLRTITSSSTTKMQGFNSLQHGSPCSFLSTTTSDESVGLDSSSLLPGSFLDAITISLSCLPTDRSPP